MFNSSTFLIFVRQHHEMAALSEGAYKPIHWSSSIVYCCGTKPEAFKLFLAAGQAGSPSVSIDSATSIQQLTKVKYCFVHLRL